mgnify:CR=1 FL=1
MVLLSDLSYLIQILNIVSHVMWMRNVIMNVNLLNFIDVIFHLQYHFCQ